jgi:hypothetical protein
MEIKYKTLEQIVHNVEKFRVCSTNVGAYERNPDRLKLKPDTIDNLRSLVSELLFWAWPDLYKRDFREEVDLNISEIDNDGKVKRYLHYIKQKLSDLLDEIQSLFPNDLVGTGSFIELLTNHINSGDIQQGFKFEDPITGFKIMQIAAMEKLQDAIEYTNDKISDLNSFTESDSLYDLKLDRHKLILLQRTGVFEYLCEKYINVQAPLMIKEDFKKLIANLIGATTKEIGSDVGKLIAENTDKKKTKTVETPGAIKSVNSFLASLGLST